MRIFSPSQLEACTGSRENRQDLANVEGAKLLRFLYMLLQSEIDIILKGGEYWCHLGEWGELGLDAFRLALRLRYFYFNNGRPKGSGNKLAICS